MVADFTPRALRISSPADREISVVVDDWMAVRQASYAAVDSDCFRNILLVTSTQPNTTSKITGRQNAASTQATPWRFGRLHRRLGFVWAFDPVAIIRNVLGVWKSKGKEHVYRMHGNPMPRFFQEFNKTE